MGSPIGHQALLVVDVGSTFTKAALVQVSADSAGDETGAVLGRAETPTTLDTDVMDGVRSLAAHLGDAAAVDDGRIVACSSAGGGPRLAGIG